MTAALPTAPSLFGALPLLMLPADAGQPRALAPLPATAPELLACGLVTLAALGLAWILLRRSASTDERARALQQQLSCEREARCQADQALAANHDVMWRLVRQHEGVRDGERSRIARDLQAELGRRLLVLRGELARLQGGSDTGPALAHGLEGALATIDGVIAAVRAVAGGLRGFGPGDGLRHALERCLVEHAQLHGVRYRFEAGLDPDSRGSRDRAARMVVLRVLQAVLAASAPVGVAALVTVRLSEGVDMLGLQIDGCASANGGAALPDDLLVQVQALGGILRTPVAGPGMRAGRWTLSIPVRELAAAA